MKRRRPAGISGALITLVLFVVALTGPAAATAQEIEADVIAVDRGTPGIIRLAVEVPGVRSTELPDVAVTSGSQPLSIGVEPLDAPAMVVLVFDTSGSMAGARIAAAKRAAAECVALLPAETEVGLVAYADRASKVVPPSLDHTAVLAVLDGLVVGGETATFDAITGASHFLQNTHGPEIVTRLLARIDAE